MRPFNSDSSGGPFNSAIVSVVWNKATVVAGHDPGTTRKDSCGAWIQRPAYGTTGEYGWEIDHDVPVARGGTDVMTNLQPLHWKNNRGKSDDYPRWHCTVK